MATITPQTVSATGTNVTLVAATAAGDTVAKARSARLIVKNGDTVTHTVTFAGSIACSQGSTHPVSVSVPAGGIAHIPVPPQAVNATTGNAAVTYDAVTSVTVGAVY